jgi:hypothetical protein
LPGDVIMAMGTPTSLDRLEALFETDAEPVRDGSRMRANDNRNS